MAFDSTSGSENLVYARAVSTLTAQYAGIKASPWHYDLIPAQAGTREFGTLTYAVGLLETEIVNPDNRQKGGTDLQLRSIVGVRVLGRLRPDAMQSDYKAALLVASNVRQALVSAADGNANDQGPQKWRYLSQTYETVGDGTHVMITQTYMVWHVALTL